MPRRPRSMRRREAIALTAMGIGAWGGVAKAADTVTLTSGGATVNVQFGPGDFDLPRDELMGWISTAARAVTVYYGRFPVSTAAIEVKPATDKADVLGGVTYGLPARTQITVGQHTSARQLEHDWTMTHELVHMAFPSVSRQHNWIEEGLATYVEPIARAQAGSLSAERVWAEMVRDMPQGQPGPQPPSPTNAPCWLVKGPGSLWYTGNSPGQAVSVFFSDGKSGAFNKSISLPGTPTDITVSADGQWLAVIYTAAAGPSPCFLSMLLATCR
jgi:hypothetical protein